MRQALLGQQRPVPASLPRTLRCLRMASQAAQQVAIHTGRVIQVCRALTGNTRLHLAGLQTSSAAHRSRGRFRDCQRLHQAAAHSRPSRPAQRLQPTRLTRLPCADQAARRPAAQV